jgi:cell fate regulator YaaT (PSP1 superfamily)
MSSGPVKTGAPAKPGTSPFANVPPNTQAILLDKLNARTSTPDSDALASSDDETELHRPENPPPAPIYKPVRRPSWLSETAPVMTNPRKGSFAGNSMSPTASHPATPAAEPGTGPWAAAAAGSGGVMNRQGGASTFQWPQAAGIWNTERKEPPSRLTEVLPSPTSTMPPGSAGHGGSFFGSNDGVALQTTSPGPRESGPIPFSIPLHPTPKTYRSQSYSVGQVEPDSAAAAAAAASSAAPSSAMGSSQVPTGRHRGHPGLHHRPSRPSMLSEMSEGGLGKVKEVEDGDEESPSGSLHSSQHMSAESQIEYLTRENAMLRQQQHQHQQQLHNSRIRQRQASYIGNGYGLRGPVPEEADFAIDELDESNEAAEIYARQGLPRRMSEFGTSMFRGYTLENRKLENIKKGAWMTSPVFAGLGDISQSRRHSFADIPVRQPSMSSLIESAAALDSGSIDPHQQDLSGSYTDASLNVGSPVAAYFTPGGSIAAQNQQALGSYPSQYGLHNSFGARPPSPHRNVYNVQPRHNQLLHVVLFKCARADVFYIQEGTGLTVKKGDLVIVEADRGTDLGTVAEDNVDWQTAKDLKEHYAEEHYKWLMMYSQNATASSEGGGNSMMGSTNGLQGSAIGGMGPAQSQHHVQEPNAGELKPKLIKRLAQPHEIHTLREKEGNEAKAKRTCMQKVKEHNLNMEILDAEYQMDWKKLTFYYFADSYINFNSLVTDLFKIYKTRIWMSAINPASFASPTLGIQAPSGVGIGAVGVRGPGSERRQSQQHQSTPQPQQEHQQQSYAPGPVSRAFQGPVPVFTQPFGMERSQPPTAANFSPTAYPYAQFTTLNAAGRPLNIPYIPAMQNMEAIPAGFEYPIAVRGRFPTSPQGTIRAGVHPSAVSPVPSQTEWAAAFQGLSLNTR